MTKVEKTTKNRTTYLLLIEAIVERRKWRKNEKDRVNEANEILQRYVANQTHLIERERELLVEITSSIETIKLWYNDENISRLPEVD